MADRARGEAPHARQPLELAVQVALGRLPGWLAQFREMSLDPAGRIFRPRQVYTGPAERDYVPVEQR